MPQAVAGPEIERLIQLLARLPGLGVTHLLVLGGTPILHEKMAELLRKEKTKLEVRYVDGTSAVFTRDDANVALRWADAVAVWSSTPLPHKVSTLFTDAQAARDGVQFGGLRNRMRRVFTAEFISHTAIFQSEIIVFLLEFFFDLDLQIHQDNFSDAVFDRVRRDDSVAVGDGDAADRRR